MGGDTGIRDVVTGLYVREYFDDDIARPEEEPLPPNNTPGRPPMMPPAMQLPPSSPVVNPGFR